MHRPAAGPHDTPARGGWGGGGGAREGGVDVSRRAWVGLRQSKEGAKHVYSVLKAVCLVASYTDLFRIQHGVLLVASAV